MDNLFLSLVMFLTIFLLFLFSFFLFVYRKGKRTSNRILAVFLFSLGMSMLNTLLFIDMKLFLNWPHLFLLGTPFFFVWGPSFYLYLNSLITPKFRLQKSDFYHLIPFGIVLIFVLYKFILHSGSQKINMLLTDSIMKKNEMYLLDIALNVQVIFYTIATFINLKNYQKNIKEYLSSVDKTGLNWIKFFFYWIFAKAPIDVVYLLFPQTHQYWFLGIIMINIFLFITVVIFKALTSPEIFQNIPQQVKYEGSLITEKEKLNIIAALNEIMKNKKPYRNPELTLKSLSDSLDASQRFVSQVINECFNQNFFDYINSLRVEYFKSSLTSFPDKTILELLFEAGFNSKTAFNKAFKKFTHVTPSQYRKQLTKLDQ